MDTATKRNAATTVLRNQGREREAMLLEMNNAIAWASVVILD